ncbi:transporter [Pseudomonas sp. PCH199]|uniref:SphA family protein n=1 Tax=unclassified Pseudomonas TaxID=196821 RepID=UPI000BD91EE8|nr:MULTISPECIES: transporter [unclassified Pseudomonas]MCW8277805.1 transporter [Pseudomonas sp. PCH199]PAM81966.1 hypothetical protein CES87_21695 [Pseudomonas sp. ERMR1:02]
MTSLSLLLRLLFAVLLCGQVSLSIASENGGTNWPLGVNTVVPAILPPPGGTELYNYTAFYSADSFRGNDGKSSLPDFKLSVAVEALRMVHTWGYQTDSGVKFSTGAILSGGRNTLEVAGLKDHKSGLNQLYFTPLYLTWSPTPELFLLTGFSAFIPMGNYDKKSIINTTSNYASYVQEFGLTWLPSPAWELSISPTVSFNQKNNDTDYKSGNIFDLDYNAGYRLPFNPKWQVGIAGHYTKQFSDDQINGNDVAGGNRLSKFSIGPQAVYYFDPATALVFKILTETSVKNGPKGNSFWFEFALPL